MSQTDKSAQQALHEEAGQVLVQAELIYSAAQLEQALQQLAQQINAQLTPHSEQQPVLLMPVMNGGLVLCGQLMTRMTFPLQVDYLHATRYRDKTHGSDLHWKASPQQSLQGRTLLVVDDILDEGYTLQAVLEYCRAQGAAQVYSVVLVEKNHPRARADIKADFTGLMVEDRYVFGFGMDYKGYHRNLNGIFAVAENGKNI
ncbi:MAG TPA: hypoxanthine-guanine phosphoribosyltransferase [Gammaproteobacteria bacterium]